MDRIALTNGRIVDGTGKPPVHPGTVVVSGSIIEAVGLAGEVPIPEDCRIIDVQNGTVLPTLLDGHMHVSGEPGRPSLSRRLGRPIQWGREYLRGSMPWDARS